MDMALMSHCNDLVMTVASSFGYVAAAWGGYAPVGATLEPTEALKAPAFPPRTFDRCMAQRPAIEKLRCLNCSQPMLEYGIPTCKHCII